MTDITAIIASVLVFEMSSAVAGNSSKVRCVIDPMLETTGPGVGVEGPWVGVTAIHLLLLIHLLLKHGGA